MVRAGKISTPQKAMIYIYLYIPITYYIGSFLALHPNNTTGQAIVETAVFDTTHTDVCVTFSYKSCESTISLVVIAHGRLITAQVVAGKIRNTNL